MMNSSRHYTLCYFMTDTVIRNLSWKKRSGSLGNWSEWHHQCQSYSEKISPDKEIFFTFGKDEVTQNVKYWNRDVMSN